MRLGTTECARKGQYIHENLPMGMAHYRNSISKTLTMEADDGELIAGVLRDDEGCERLGAYDILACARVHYKAGLLQERQTREPHHVIAVLDGQLDIKASRHERSVPAGHVVLLPTRRLWGLAASQPVDCIHVVLEQSARWKALVRPLISSGVNPYQQDMRELSDRLFLEQACIGEALASQVLVDATTDCLLTYLERMLLSLGTERAQGNHQLVHELWLAVRRNLRDEWPVSAMASYYRCFGVTDSPACLGV